MPEASPTPQAPTEPPTQPARAPAGQVAASSAQHVPAGNPVPQQAPAGNAAPPAHEPTPTDPPTGNHGPQAPAGNPPPDMPSVGGPVGGVEKRRAPKKRDVGEKRSSKYRGVSWKGHKKQWQASIFHDKANKHLGLYNEEEDAAQRYDDEARRLKGAAAFLNFPQPGEKKGTRHRPKEEIAAAKAAIGVKKSTDRGVSWSGTSSGWKAQIWHRGKPHYLGYFQEEVEAAKRYDTEARSLKAESAFLNFPQPGETKGTGRMKTKGTDAAGLSRKKPKLPKPPPADGGPTQPTQPPTAPVSPPAVPPTASATESAAEPTAEPTAVPTPPPTAPTAPVSPPSGHGMAELAAALARAPAAEPLPTAPPTAPTAAEQQQQHTAHPTAPPTAPPTSAASAPAPAPAPAGEPAPPREAPTVSASV
jgi:hypothetical protein